MAAENLKTFFLTFFPITFVLQFLFSPNFMRWLILALFEFNETSGYCSACLAGENFRETLFKLSRRPNVEIQSLCICKRFCLNGSSRLKRLKVSVNHLDAPVESAGDCSTDSTTLEQTLEKNLRQTARLMQFRSSVPVKVLT